MAIDPYLGFKPDPKPPAPKDAVVGTPEGDNEFPPDKPLTGLPEDAHQKPRGGTPDKYRQPEGKV